MLIASVGVEAMGDDHLRLGVHRRLRVVALDEAVLGFHDAAFGIGEVLLRFRVGVFGGRGGGSSGFLAAFGFPLLFRLGPRLALGFGGGFGLGLQFSLGGADLLGPPLLVADPGRASPRRSCRAQGGVLAGVRRRRGVHPGGDLGFQLLSPLAHPLVAHRLVLRGVGLDLRPIKRDMAELDSPARSHRRNTWPKAPTTRSMTLAELRDRARNPGVKPNDAHEIDAFPAGLGDPATNRPRCNSRRAKAPSSSPDRTVVDAINPLDPPGRSPRPPGSGRTAPGDLVDELLDRRRQQHRFIDLPGAVALAHRQAESDSPGLRQQNRRFLRQAPSDLL